MMLCKTMNKHDLLTFCKVCGNKWVAEEKYDGDRVQMRVKDSSYTLINRGLNNVTNRYPELEGVKGDFLVDGEMCVIDDNGVSQFNEGISYRSHCISQTAIDNARKEYPVTYVVFDILELNGHNLRNKPFIERRSILEGLNIQHDHIILSELSDDIIGLWSKVTSKGGEGIILKQKSSLYHDNKRRDCWRKVKDVKEVDLSFVKYEPHNKGITVTSDEGIRITVNGTQSSDVANTIDSEDECMITVRHLGQTNTGKYRQPVFLKKVN